MPVICPFIRMLCCCPTDIHQPQLCQVTRPQVYQTFTCSTQQSRKFKLPMNIEIVRNKESFMLHSTEHETQLSMKFTQLSMQFILIINMKLRIGFMHKSTEHEVYPVCQKYMSKISHCLNKTGCSSRYSVRPLHTDGNDLYWDIW